MKNVSDCVSIEKIIKVKLDEYIIVNNIGIKSEWVHMKLKKMIRMIDDIINDFEEKYVPKVEDDLSKIIETKIYKKNNNYYIKYGDVNIRIIVDNNNKIWFNAKKSAEALGYSDCRGVIRKYRDSNYTQYAEHIKYSHKNGHPQTLFLSEIGFHKFMLISMLPKAKMFSTWIIDTALPYINKKWRKRIITPSKTIN